MSAYYMTTNFISKECLKSVITTTDIQSFTIRLHKYFNKSNTFCSCLLGTWQMFRTITDTINYSVTNAKLFMLVRCGISYQCPSFAVRNSLHYFASYFHSKKISDVVLCLVTEIREFWPQPFIFLVTLVPGRPPVFVIFSAKSYYASSRMVTLYADKNFTHPRSFSCCALRLQVILDDAMPLRVYNSITRACSWSGYISGY